VEYKGRAPEFFEAEVKYIMDWMNRKKRANPTRQAGLDKQEFKTMRPEDNRFYWLGTSSVYPQVSEPAGPGWKQLAQRRRCAADIFASNTIRVRTHGVGDVTIWLGAGDAGVQRKGRRDQGDAEHQRGDRCSQGDAERGADAGARSPNRRPAAP